jgi:hypothetical protein
MPDYRMTIEGDNVAVRPKEEATVFALPMQVLRLQKPDTHAMARCLAPGWDIYGLENEWRAWVQDKGIEVKDPDKHFLAFCKSRGAYKDG